MKRKTLFLEADESGVRLFNDAKMIGLGMRENGILIFRLTKKDSDKIEAANRRWTPGTWEHWARKNRRDEGYQNDRHLMKLRNNPWIKWIQNVNSSWRIRFNRDTGLWTGVDRRSIQVFDSWELAIPYMIRIHRTNHKNHSLTPWSRWAKNVCHNQKQRRKGMQYAAERKIDPGA